MEKISYDIAFDIKNNPSESLKEINMLLTDMQGNVQNMANLMSQQLEMMRSPIDDVRNSWLDLSKDAGAYFAVISENAAGVVALVEIKRCLTEINITTKIASTIQRGYNNVIDIGKKALYIYQMQVLAANAAIATTSGATRALNILIAASPYLIAAAAAAALAVGIYKIATSSSQTTEAQKRLNTTFVEMNTEVAKERTALDALFAPLNLAKAGTEEWQKAKDKIMDKYGNYLSGIGVEITNIDTARAAYDKLTQAIIDTARARAMEKATTGASENYANAEGDALKNIRQQLYSGIGQGLGKITATQAGKAWAQIRQAVRSGSDIPQEAKEILEQTQTSYTDQYGTHVSNPIAGYIYRQVDEVRKARGVYKSEMADANAMFGGGNGNVLDNTTNTNTKTNTATPPATNYAPGSLAALEARLSELKTKQKNAPIETQLTFSADIAQLENVIAGIKMRMERAQFEALYTLKPVDPGTANGTPIKNAMQPSLGRKQEEGGLSDFKITPPKMDIEQPLSAMQQWNEAVEAARKKNTDTIDSLNAMGGAMGTLGNVVGGQAGAWMEWASNLMNAIAQALPQLAALVTGNTAVAATGAASSVASIPFVGPVLAIAAVASVLGALASLPKFANGGIAYGPTLGLFGEYAGASNNPEVVAPLSRLKQMIQPAGSDGIGGGIVRFKIDGRALTGVLERENNLNRRS